VTTSFLPRATLETVSPFINPGATSFLPADDRFTLLFRLRTAAPL